MEDPTQLLNSDVLAEVLRRFESPCRLAAARCVCKAWRDVVDSYGLLRVDLLPLSLAGIFTNINDVTEFPKYFSPVSSASIAPFDYLDTHDADNLMIMRHCNGLLLLGYEETRVLNPATRQWACLPSPPSMCTPCMEGADELISSCTTDHDMYLVFDPTVSSDYKVFLIKYIPYHPYPDDYFQLAESEVHAREWPPSTFVFLVFSSRTQQWEEKLFIREVEAAGTIGHMFNIWPCYRYAAYWRGALYLHQHDFLMRYLAYLHLKY
jgi:hypothetical protein